MRNNHRDPILRSLTAFSAVLLAGVFSATAGWAEPVQPEVSVTAKVRDFKEINSFDTVGTHPHFNNRFLCSAQGSGYSVKPDLDVNGPADGGAFAGDERGPMLMDILPPSLTDCYAPVERFSEWFSDKPGVNRAFLVEMRFQWDASSGNYQFGESSFFPIDNGKAFTKVDPADTGTFGHLQAGIVDGIDLSTHDYGFTMEVHTDFTYKKGRGQQVTIRGDDDIWLFLNGKRAIDLGGVHQVQSSSVHLDSLVDSLGLVDGENYPFDFFFAERHTASSSCSISTNLSIGKEVPTAARPRFPFLNPRTGFPERFEIYDRTGRRVASLVGGSAALESWMVRERGGLVPGVYAWKTVPSRGSVSSGLLIFP